MATITELTAEIVSAHLSTTMMTTDELIQELHKVHSMLKSLETGETVISSDIEKNSNALTVKEAFKKNEVICLVCGTGGFKTLTRHLNTSHQMKPNEYRKQFGIDAKQPLSAKSLTEARRKFAKENGLAQNMINARVAKAAASTKAPKTPKKS